MLSVNFNSASRNAVDQVGIAQRGISKVMTALSTGERINNAADDVAGSAMASRMQVQSNSLDTAVTNANMGINLIQTMDGAMKETETLLQRMTKLTEMSKNDAYSAQDRDMMDQEFGSLVDELDRNSQSANYNGISLINNASDSAGSALFSKDISKGIIFTAADVTAKPPVVANNTLTFNVSTAPMTATVPAIPGTPVPIAISVDFGTKSLSANEIIGTINKALKAAGANAKAILNSDGHLKIDSDDRVDGVKLGASTIDTIAGSAVTAKTGLGAGTATDGKTGFSDIVINVGSLGNSYDNIALRSVDLSSEGLGLKGASLTNSSDLDNILSTLKTSLDTVSKQKSALRCRAKASEFCIR
ncbi:flagellin N-terminal helical domain-containing protein [Photobacterium kishitanii]|uniref:flagellin N-terminal helical domain-containing protein n=1 Tax=Photobacterium kishitanii TaxID=318456 RepID=UPI0027399EBB|nr:hypothetical protein [Photobacterium kishitanii]